MRRPSLRSQARRIGRLSIGRSAGQSSRSRYGLMKRARSFRLPWLSTMLYRSSLGRSRATSNSRSPYQVRWVGSTTTPCQGPCRSSSRSGSRAASGDHPANTLMEELSVTGRPPAAPSGQRYAHDMENAVPATPAEDAPPARTGPAWRFLIQPRWVGWHLLVVVAFWGMLWLGDWQFHRAISG